MWCIEDNMINNSESSIEAETFFLFLFILVFYHKLINEHEL